MISSPVEEIKNRLDVIDLVGQYIKLQKAGANYRALCPFHAEKKPSFFVSPTRQTWHCFGGCGEGGDIFKFVMRIEGVEFGDALRALAQKAGVELRPRSPEYEQWKTERQRLYEILELACLFFEKQLFSNKTGLEAKDYLLDRGITEASLKKWRVGYAPDVWQGLCDFLVGRGYKREEGEKAGLAIKNDQGGFYDRFRGRIMFPVFDLNSQAIGFGGRVFKTEDPAKYVNTPSTLLYDKSRALYGIDKAKLETRKQNSCILVEGYVDAIMCSQAGQENVVATSGTALTPFQLRILKRYSENLLTAFDMDVAGDSATKRGIELALAEGFNVKVLTMPEGMDPADIIAKASDIWGKIVSSPKSIIEFYFQTAFSRHDSSVPEGKKEIAKIVLPAIKKIPNKIEQSHWAQRLADKLAVKEEDIDFELKKVREDSLPEFARPAEELKELPPKTRKELLEERLVCLSIAYPEHQAIITGDLLHHFSEKNQNALRYLQSGQRPTEEQNREMFDFLNYLELAAEAQAEDFQNIDTQAEISTCLQEIRAFELKDKLSEISQEIKRAEEEKNAEKVISLMQEFNKLSKDLVRDVDSEPESI